VFLAHIISAMLLIGTKPTFRSCHAMCEEAKLKTDHDERSDGGNNDDRDKKRHRSDGGNNDDGDKKRHRSSNQTKRASYHDTSTNEKNMSDMALVLPSDYIPSSLDVIVGTGREPKNHQGNINFRETLKGYIGRYSNSQFKLDKTLIISEIVQAVRETSPTKTGFVKKVNSRWQAVGDHLSREKVSQGLRNILSDQYRSSSKAKKRHRGQLCAEIDKNIDTMMQTKQSFLSTRMSKLSVEMKRKGDSVSDDEVFKMFTQANIDILEGLKKENILENRMEAKPITLSASSGKKEQEENNEDEKLRAITKP
jgi:hypothetical protein